MDAHRTTHALPLAAVGLSILSVQIGATLTILADLVARTVASPAEVPLGILTALLGAPFFLMLLWRNRGQLGL